jgi:hypothetical protein
MVNEAYAGLKVLVEESSVAAQPPGLVLARHEQAPETWQAPFLAELAGTRADSDNTFKTPTNGWALHDRRCQVRQLHTEARAERRRRREITGCVFRNQRLRSG